MYSPNRENFLRLSAKGNLIPIYREILADMETPVSAYFKLAYGSKYSFLLESVEGEEKVARFSFLAKEPELILRSQNGTVEFIRTGRVEEKKVITESPLQ